MENLLEIENRINVISLSKNFDDFDVIVISEPGNELSQFVINVAFCNEKPDAFYNKPLSHFVIK